MPEHDKNIKRILLVDDEYDITLTIKVVLEQNGFIVDSFTDVSENFRTSLYDLVVLDVKMPEIDGFSLYEMASKDNGEPIIAKVVGTRFAAVCGSL